MDLLRPHIRGLATYEAVDPTEVLAQRAGIPPEKVIRLNGNENPYSSSPRLTETLGSYNQYNRYPDPEQRHLREALSDYLGIGPEHIVAGNGSDEIIDLALRMVLGPGERIIDPAPTFGMYAICARICGGGVLTVPRDGCFEIDLEATRLAVDSTTKAILFASPNNPTGNVAQEWQVRSLLETGILVVVDETYYEFCGTTVLPLVREYPNLMVLRTFSKWAGLAGLRIGLGVMDPQVARVMMSVKPPYNVNLAAEIALLASLEDRPRLLRQVSSIVAERERMFSLLGGLPGLKPWPSQANFILCQVPKGKGKAVYEGLARRGVFLRHFSNPRLADYVRASVGLPHETDAAIEALSRVLGELA
jgi:histidinol-phosphate aminotransferase